MAGVPVAKRVGPRHRFINGRRIRDPRSCASNAAVVALGRCSCSSPAVTSSSVRADHSVASGSSTAHACLTTPAGVGCGSGVIAMTIQTAATDTETAQNPLSTTGSGIVTEPLRAGSADRQVPADAMPAPCRGPAIGR